MPDRYALMLRQPIGAIGAILPWNYPSENLAWKLAPALAAGNCVVLKPAEQATASVLFTAWLACECGLPPGVVNVVPGQGERAGAGLVAHPGLEAIFFTGSTDTARQIQQHAARYRVKRVALEAGGKGAALLCEDWADNGKAALDIANSIFLNAGQTCNACARVLVHRSKRDAFLEQLVTLLPDYEPGDPRLPTTRVGALVDHAVMARFEEQLADARQRGACILYGGDRRTPVTGGAYFSPTVVVDAPLASPLVQQELFGPILAVNSFETIEEGIAIVNGTRYGLAAAIYSGNPDLRCIFEYAARIESGVVYLNRYGGDDISVPFGGIKESGAMMREKGVAAFDAYSEIKSIVW